MSQLSIALLGSPQVFIDKNLVKLPTSRAIPLLAYLALNQYPQTRETLANLLWTESNSNQALAALRTTLWRLKGTGLEEWIAWDRNEIAITNQNNLDIDVQNFQAQLDHCDTHGHPPTSLCLYCTPALTEAVNLYRGEFMKGCNIPKAPAFDDWRMQQSGIYEYLYLNALERLVKCHRTFGDFNLAIHYARIWQTADWLNEDPQLQLLQLYSITGQRTAAVSLYKHYKDNLFRELGLQPSDELTALYKQIVSGRSAPVSKPKTITPVILIAEIEKAALYYAEVGEKKNHILNTYMNAVRDTTRRFGGNILQKTDDNVSILFENGQSLHCAVSLHFMLKKANWGGSTPPSIRMVIFSTVMEYDNAPNFALLTHAASSLLAMSWGGQIVFTDQTLRKLDLPTGATVKDLGYHYLSDSEGSVHVFELRHPNLPHSDHPPLSSRTRLSNNLPAFEPLFIGREQELEQLSQLVLSPSNRFVSLIGPGGVGKTRLAVEFASHVLDHFPDGIFFISLASIQDPNYIPIVVADTLKFSFYGPTSQDEQLGDYLHHMKSLLIVDNIDHLRIEGAKFLASLLSKTHYLKILVTSRERLNLIAEAVMDLRGFPVPDSFSARDARNFSSVKLFLQNAHKTSPRFSDQNNLEAIVRICQIVDGLPLGILLASSWVRVFSCAEIASEINRNFEFLTSTAPDLDPRHRSLKAVFDSSWKLLSEEERRIVRSLAIFNSSFSISAALEICNATPLVLSTLIDKSILYLQPDGRYIMLSTLNHYVKEKLAVAVDVRTMVREKYCEFYAEFCDQIQAELYSPSESTALNEIHTEIDNIRAAWGLMLDANHWDLLNKYLEALIAYHSVFGNYYQGRELFNIALIKLKKLNLPEYELLQAALLRNLMWMEFLRGFSSDTLTAMEECIDIFQKYNASWEIARTLYYMSEINRTAGNLVDAKNLIEQTIALMQSNSSAQSNQGSSIIAYCQAALGRILINLRDYEQAKRYLKISLETQQQAGTIHGTITPLLGLARLAFLQGEFLQARDLYHQALDCAIKINDHHSIMVIHNNLSDVYEAIANVPKSQHHLQTALKLCEETGDRRLIAVIMNNVAYQQLKYDDQPTESLRTYHECLKIFSELGDLRGIAYTSYDVSKAYIKISSLDEAWNSCLRALNTALTLDNIPMALHALHGFANYFAETGQSGRAYILCDLIISHPEVESDTQKRAIVSKAMLEASLSSGSIRSYRSTAGSSDLHAIINHILSEKPHTTNN